MAALGRQDTRAPGGAQLYPTGPSLVVGSPLGRQDTGASGSGQVHSALAGLAPSPSHGVTVGSLFTGTAGLGLAEAAGLPGAHTAQAASSSPTSGAGQLGASGLQAQGLELLQIAPQQEWASFVPEDLTAEDVGEIFKDNLENPNARAHFPLRTRSLTQAKDFLNGRVEVARATARKHQAAAATMAAGTPGRDAELEMMNTAVRRLSGAQQMATAMNDLILHFPVAAVCPGGRVHQCVADAVVRRRSGVQPTVRVYRDWVPTLYDEALRGTLGSGVSTASSSSSRPTVREAAAAGREGPRREEPTAKRAHADGHHGGAGRRECSESPAPRGPCYNCGGPGRVVRRIHEWNAGAVSGT